jgi:hypothetical protein
MTDKNSKSEIKKTAEYRRWYRYHAKKIPGWTPFRYPLMSYPPMEFMLYPRIHPEDELHILEREKQFIKGDLDRIEKRIEEIKKESKEVK